MYLCGVCSCTFLPVLLITCLAYIEQRVMVSDKFCSLINLHTYVYRYSMQQCM